jgi:hypothetical protein
MNEIYETNEIHAMNAFVAGAMVSLTSHGALSS